MTIDKVGGWMPIHLEDIEDTDIDLLMVRGERAMWVQHNKCDKGRAIEEVDGNVYCFGITDAMFEDTVYKEACKGCPRLLANNEDKIAEWIAKQRKESE